VLVADDVVLLGELREEFNFMLEASLRSICIGGIETKYMTCNFTVKNLIITMSIWHIFHKQIHYTPSVPF